MGRGSNVKDLPAKRYPLLTFSRLYGWKKYGFGHQLYILIPNACNPLPNHFQALWNQVNPLLGALFSRGRLCDEMNSLYPYGPPKLQRLLYAIGNLEFLY